MENHFLFPLRLSCSPAYLVKLHSGSPEQKHPWSECLHCLTSLCPISVGKIPEVVGEQIFLAHSSPFLTKYLRNRHGFRDTRDKPKWALESFLVLIIELEGRAEKQKHGPSPQLSWGFLQFSPKSFFSLLPLLSSFPLLFWCSVNQRDKMLILPPLKYCLWK